MDSRRRPELRPSSALGSMRADKKVGEDGDDDDPKDEDGELGFEGDKKKKKKKLMAIGGSGRRGSAAATGGCVGGASQPQCQADNCAADLSCAKRYHRRHKVCELHANSPVVLVAGLQQRFCQQCSRFHEISEFDEAKKSCRKRLAGHNQRRRKSSSESHGEGSSNGEMDLQLKENHCRLSDEKGRAQITLPVNPSLKHFHIR